jgi:acyl-CoA synthetase (AMP-forming)/AMP-acid ligase II
MMLVPRCTVCSVSSGTTGRPKGVVTAQSASLSHFNMANFSDPLAYIARGDFDGARALFETRMSTTAGPRPPIGLFDVRALPFGVAGVLGILSPCGGPCECMCTMVSVCLASVCFVSGSVRSARLRCPPSPSTCVLQHPCPLLLCSPLRLQRKCNIGIVCCGFFPV